MWQTENDLRARIQNLDSRAGDRYARLFDTLTETDGSAEPRGPLLERLADRIRRALQGVGSGPQPTMLEPASVGRAR